MPADTTIAIMVTRGHESGYEYRVAVHQAIENLYWKPDYPADNPVLNRQEMIVRFRKSPVLRDMEKAEHLAHQLELKYESLGSYIEYGIKTLDYSNIFFPQNLLPLL